MYAQFRPAGKNGDFNAYIVKSFRAKKGDKTSSQIVEKLGRLSKIAEQHAGIDPREYVEQRARELTEAEKSEDSSITIRLSPTKRIPADRKRRVHGGDLLLNPLFYELGLDDICRQISVRGKFEYDLTDIMKKLVYGRILFPDSKLGTWGRAQSFIRPQVRSVGHISGAWGDGAGIGFHTEPDIPELTERQCA